jgi:hypothetical protein
MGIEACHIKRRCPESGIPSKPRKVNTTAGQVLHPKKHARMHAGRYICK